jgi:hypothetical protein
MHQAAIEALGFDAEPLQRRLPYREQSQTARNNDSNRPPKPQLS